MPDTQGNPALAISRLQRDTAIQQAITILHEVGHLTGAQGPHENVLFGGQVVTSADEAIGLYNTRIYNSCFSPLGYLIGGVSCTANPYFNSYYDFGTTLECFGFCDIGAGPLTLSWTSNLSPTVTTDVHTFQDGETCSSVRTSRCPPMPPGDVARVTFTATDATGRRSVDTALIDCIQPILINW